MNKERKHCEDSQPERKIILVIKNSREKTPI
jgi:hypothetical protein